MDSNTLVHLWGVGIINSMQTLVIATHSNYRHWQYLVEAAIEQKSKGTDVVFVDARGIASNDLVAFKIQKIEQIISGNLVNRANSYMRRSGINVKTVDNKLISHEALTQQNKLSDFFSDQLDNCVEMHQICEAGFLDAPVQIEPQLKFEVLSGYLLMKLLYSANPSLDLVIMSHGRLPIQLGIILFLKEIGIPYSGVQQGGSQNSFHLIAGGVHNFRVIRNELQNFSIEQVDNLSKFTDFDFFYETTLRKNRFTKNMRTDSVPPELLSVKYAVFFTGLDGEDIFVINKEECIDFYINEITALVDFVKVCEEKNIIPVVRLHPGYKSLDDRVYLTERIKKIHEMSDKIYLINYESEIDSYELGMGAIISISYHSTIGLELSYLGKPTIFCGPTYFSSILQKNHVKDIHEMLEAFENLLIVEKAKLHLIHEYNSSKGTKFLIFDSQGTKNYMAGQIVLTENRLLKMLRLVRNQLQKFIKIFMSPVKK
jgi:hypothetical protein